MNHPYYEYFALFQSYRYDFTSIGKNVIRKTVLFEQLDEENLFNLVLGDINSNGKVDVFAISDNGDFKKVFATVFQVLSTFLENHPLAIVVFYGSSLARTRLYQIAISRELEQLEERFVVKGLANFIFEPFVKNKPYEAFSFSLKKM